MEYEKIKQLMEDMGNSKLTSLDIDFPDGTKISMKKECACNDECKCSDDCECVDSRRECSVASGDCTSDVEKASNTTKQQDNRKLIKSPMVGTFYMKPSPTADPYVEIGQSVSIGDTVCIIEAMKLMNEIESDVSGKVVEIFVNDGDPVEYGMPLFAIE